MHKISLICVKIYARKDNDSEACAQTVIHQSEQVKKLCCSKVCAMRMLTDYVAQNHIVMYLQT
jgi:hypothetical protein